MRYAIIEHGTIINVIECDPANPLPGATPIEGLDPEPGIGWTTSDSGQTWTPPAPPPPTPQQTARATLLQMTANIGAWQQQIASDSALWQGTKAGSTLGQNHIDSIIRVVEGFQTVLDAMQALGVATSILPPPAA